MFSRYLLREFAKLNFARAIAGQWPKNRQCRARVVIRNQFQPQGHIRMPSIDPYINRGEAKRFLASIPGSTASPSLKANGTPITALTVLGQTRFEHLPATRTNRAFSIERGLEIRVSRYPAKPCLRQPRLGRISMHGIKNSRSLFGAHGKGLKANHFLFPTSTS